MKINNISTDTCMIKQNRERKHFCMYCLQCFRYEDALKKHQSNCIMINGKQAIKILDKDYNILKFNNLIYADFEAITVKPNNKSYAETYQKHTDCGYGYKVVCCYDDKYSKPVQIYRGENTLMS